MGGTLCRAEPPLAEVNILLITSSNYSSFGLVLPPPAPGLVFFEVLRPLYKWWSHPLLSFTHRDATASVLSHRTASTHSGTAVVATSL